MPSTTRRSVVRLGSWTAVGIVVLYVGRNLAKGLVELASHPLPAPPRWDLLLLSGLLFLSAHAVLVQTWRSMLGTWDQRLPFWTAARIWSVSNLGKYVPGKIWQIGTMSAMSRDIGISPVIAPTAAILGTLLSVIAGFAVALASGEVVLESIRPGWSSVAMAFLCISIFALIGAPIAVPPLARLASKVTGRAIGTTLPMRAIVYGLAGSVAAWLIYGAAFEVLTVALLGRVTGDYSAYLAAYTISYLFGYLALFAPAGVGVRELFMQAVLGTAHLATAPQSALITITSRVWITILEVTPALMFWVAYRMRHRTTATEHSDVPT